MKKALYLSVLCISVFIFAFSAGNTFAYWVTENKTNNLVQTGKLAADIAEEYQQNQIVYPGDVISKKVNVSNVGDVESIIRVKVTKAWEQIQDDGSLIIDSTLSTDNILIAYNTTVWAYDDADGYFYYKKILKPGETTVEPLFSEFRITDSTDNTFANMHAKIDIDMESVQAAYGGATLWGKALESLGIADIVPNSHRGNIPLITFTDPIQSFQFQSDRNDIFCAWEHLIPGENRSQTISLENVYSAAVPISIRAEYHPTGSSAEEQALIDDLIKKYVWITITDESGETIYSGSLWGNLDAQSGQTMNADLPLGTFAPQQKRNYSVTIQVSPALDNRYSNLTGIITWVFQANGSSEAAYPSPGTGDSFQLPFELALMVISGGMILSLLIRRKKSHTSCPSTRKER